MVEVDLQLGEVKLLHTDLCAGDAGALDQGAVLGRSQVWSHKLSNTEGYYAKLLFN